MKYFGKSPINDLTEKITAITPKIQEQGNIFYLLKQKLVELNTRIKFNPKYVETADKVDNLVIDLINKLDVTKNETKLKKIKDLTLKEERFAVLGVIILLGSVVLVAYYSNNRKPKPND